MKNEKSTPATRPPGEKTCPRCRGGFVCGMAAGEQMCWCAELPPVLPVPLDMQTGCLCPDCLRALSRPYLDADTL